MTRFFGVPKKGPPKRASQGVRETAGNQNGISERVGELHAAPERVARGFAVAQLSGLVVQRIAHFGIRKHLGHDADPRMADDRLDLVVRCLLYTSPSPRDS